jgi:DNA-directed RNA polymerase subunit RPC12/RpoP
MAELSQHESTTYRCRTCDVRFSLPSHETAICCPVCRMNRVVAVRD